MSVQPAVATKPSLTLKRYLKATPDRVFAAWTEPEKIAQWFGPEEIELLRAEADAHVGGRFRIVMRGRDGEEHDVSGLYREVVPNERLVYTNVVDFVPNVIAYDVDTRVELKASGKTVKLKLTLDAMHDDEWTNRAVMGWESELEKLRKVLQP